MLCSVTDPPFDPFLAAGLILYMNADLLFRLLDFIECSGLVDKL